MAIFDFVKQAGAAVSSTLEAGLDTVDKAAKAASKVAESATQEATLAAITAKIAKASIVCADLSLKFVDSETVKIYAVVTSLDDREKLILIVGNTAGVSKVEDAVKVRSTTGQEVTERPAPRFYNVKAGDTLSSIAAEKLGSADRYMDIYNANSHHLDHPDAIDVGQTLRIP